MAHGGAVLISAALLFCSCGSNGGVKNVEEEGSVREFPMVSVPAMMDSPAERAEYVAMHYFDPLTRVDAPASSETKSSANGVKYLCDSSHVAGVPMGQIEQAVATWCESLNMVSQETAEKASGRLFSRIEACEKADTSSNVFERLGKLVDRYLYDPNSPLRNEDFYTPFVLARSKSSLLSSEEQKSAAETARRCSLNKVGTRAADFRFSDRQGRTRTLYSIKADRTLLFFSNPGCNACKEIIDALKSYPQMEKMISSGELAVLNIYIDEDLKEWYEYMPIYPDSWYNGYDPDYAIRTDMLYDVRAIPSLYLLASDKTVLMKDAPTEKVLRELFGE